MGIYSAPLVDGYGRYRANSKGEKKKKEERRKKEAVWYAPTW